MQAVILAGGKGTRLAPYTMVLPKPLMPIGNMPILEIIFRQLAREGITKIELATGYLSALIEAYFADGARFGVQIRYHHEDAPSGTAGPLASLGGVLDDNFLIMNGDVLTDLNFGEFFKNHMASGAILTAATCARAVTLPLGAIMYDGAGRVSDYIEKPTYQFECSAGIYAAKREVLNYIPRDIPFDLPDLVRALIRAKSAIRTQRIAGFWLDIGTPEDYRQANDTYADHFSASLVP